jgi:hypothetical protein
MNSNTMTMRTRTRQVDGLTIRYADTDAANGPDILLTRPWPESLLAFRRIWPALATSARPARPVGVTLAHPVTQAACSCLGVAHEGDVQVGVGGWPRDQSPDTNRSVHCLRTAAHPVHQ